MKFNYIKPSPLPPLPQERGTTLLARINPSPFPTAIRHAVSLDSLRFVGSASVPRRGMKSSITLRIRHTEKYLNQKLLRTNNDPLLEIKDFGPPTTYGEDKELKLNEKTTLLPIPPPRGGRIEVHRHTKRSEVSQTLSFIRNSSQLLKFN